MLITAWRMLRTTLCRMTYERIQSGIRACWALQNTILVAVLVGDTRRQDPAQDTHIHQHDKHDFAVTYINPFEN